MNAFVFDSVDESYTELLRAILEGGVTVSPREIPTKELALVSITINNPRKRIISHPLRGLNYSFMVAELLWILRGSNSVAEISHYNKQWLKYSDDGETLNGAYGQRIFKYEGLQKFETAGHEFYHPDTVNQFDFVFKRLREDAGTRQGTIVLWDPKKDMGSSKDLPCTNLLRFTIRDGRLNMVTFMRSNDAWLGYPYDVFNFTMLQEIMAGLLDVEMGTYTHIVDSFHLYDTHFDKARELINFAVPDVYANRDVIDARLSIDDYDAMIHIIQDIEEATRLDTDYDIINSLDALTKVNTYWASLAGIITRYNFKKHKKDFTTILPYITNEFSLMLKGDIKPMNENNTQAPQMQQAPQDPQDPQELVTSATDIIDGTTQQPKGIQKIVIETDGTLKNTRIILDDQAVPMLVRAEFLADISEGIVLHLDQVVVNDKGEPETDEEGKVKVNTFTISRQVQQSDETQPEAEPTEEISE